VAYGLIYTAVGYYLYTGFDSDAFRDVGVVALLAGIFTTIFGVLYGEFFGLHMFGSNFFDVGGLPVVHKGIQPAEAQWARFWFLVTILFGAAHLAIGYLFEFFEAWNLHGLWDAITEAGSWLLALAGLWIFVFSDALKSMTYDPSQPVQFGETVGASENLPLFVFWILDDGPLAVAQLGFDGFPTTVGYVGIAMFVGGLVLLALGPTYELVEFHIPLAHTLSYLRISAVLLAKAGMAFAANVLYFGAYEHHGEYHFMISHGPEYVRSHYGADAIIFSGMYNSGLGIALVGILVLVLGQAVVLLLGITSAGIQSIRLEYFEFFTKFYQGNGREYVPFGHDRTYTSDE